MLRKELLSTLKSAQAGTAGNSPDAVVLEPMGKYGEYNEWKYSTKQGKQAFSSSMLMGAGSFSEGLAAAEILKPKQRN